MAIGKYSAVPPPPEPSAHHYSPPAQPPTVAQNVPSHTHSASGTIDIEAWTIHALQSLSVSPDSRGTGGQPLAIPLDNHSRARGVTIALDEEQAAGAGIAPPRRMPMRRDSLKRREALLKGKEGSRQRRRWDMGWPSPLSFSLSLSPLACLQDCRNSVMMANTEGVYSASD